MSPAGREGEETLGLFLPPSVMAQEPAGLRHEISKELLCRMSRKVVAELALFPRLLCAEAAVS